MPFLRRMKVAAQQVVIGMIGKTHSTLKNKEQPFRNSLKFRETSNLLTPKRKRRSLKRRRTVLPPVEMLLTMT
jgi:hypothetical protein